MMNRSIGKGFLMAALALGVAETARAEMFSPDGLAGLSNAALGDIVKTVAIGADHRAYQPATSLGLVLGFDVGVEATMITLPESFQTAFTTAAGLTGSTTAPASLLVPRFNVHKGLPFGIDIGVSWFGLMNTNALGIEAQYELIGGMALPSLSLRASYTTFSSDDIFIQTNTFKVDAVISKNLLVVDPYVGAGIQMGSGSLKLTDAQLADLPSNVENSASVTSPHFFVGVPVKLGFLHFTGEYDYSLSGVTTMGGKLSIGF